MLHFVLGSIIAIPKAGTVVVISGIVGQMIGSYLIDAFGLLGVDKVPFSWIGLGGIGLLVLCLAAANEVGDQLFEPAFEAIRNANRGTLSAEELKEAILRLAIGL